LGGALLQETTDDIINRGGLLVVDKALPVVDALVAHPAEAKA
jgi:hypothetical protein